MTIESVYLTSFWLPSRRAEHDEDIAVDFDDQGIPWLVRVIRPILTANHDSVPDSAELSIQCLLDVSAEVLKKEKQNFRKLITTGDISINKLCVIHVSTQ